MRRTRQGPAGWSCRCPRQRRKRTSSPSRRCEIATPGSAGRGRTERPCSGLSRTTRIQTWLLGTLLRVAQDPYLTIGEFSRRVGVSIDLLRAWERRYGVPRPVRTANGRRLYTREDELLVHAMRQALDRGIPAAEA